MTEKQIAEITRKARQDVVALRSGWPSRGNPYHSQAESDLYEEEFTKALKEGRK